MCETKTADSLLWQDDPPARQSRKVSRNSTDNLAPVLNVVVLSSHIPVIAKCPPQIGEVDQSRRRASPSSTWSSRGAATECGVSSFSTFPGAHLHGRQRHHMAHGNFFVFSPGPQAEAKSTTRGCVRRCVSLFPPPPLSRSREELEG